MEKRKFYIEFRNHDGVAVGHVAVTAYTIDHALQVANAWACGKQAIATIAEIRAEPKRGAKYEVEL